MGSNELSLDYKPNVDITLSTTPEADQPDPTRKLRQFLARLEQERLKIDVFKKELPLCMQLLNNAMEVYKQQLGGGGGGGGGEKMAVTEEFLPVVKKSCTSDDEGDNSEPLEKANWLASVQLWTQSNNEVDSSPKRWNTGAFLPFSKEKPVDKAGGCSDLALAPVEDNRPSVLETIEERDEKCDNISATPNLENSGGGGGGGGGQAAGMGSSGGQNQSHRKARRCWSPDLHRRFVNALQVLGGSQVATPKQIRELMKVDGLTNDEVKSHLQKYRLHTRRPLPPAPQHAVASGHPQLVVLGGIWVPPEYATSTTVYSTHTSNPAQFCTTAATPLSRGFYSSPAAPQPPQATNAHSHCSITRHICGGLQGMVKGNREETSESTEEEIKEEVEVERKSGSSSSNGGGGGGGGGGVEEDSNGSDMY